MMNAASIIVLLLLTAAVIAAGLSLKKHGSGCAGCNGDCANCHKKQ